jgi:DNA-directed RNA polymerase subunit N
MIIPVRCFSCGKPIGHLWEKFKQEVEKGKDSGKVMTDLGIERYCCRQIFLSHVDLIDVIARFKKF